MTVTESLLERCARCGHVNAEHDPAPVCDRRGRSAVISFSIAPFPTRPCSSVGCACPRFEERKEEVP